MLPLDPPLPIDAAHHAFPNRVVVTFDKPIQPGLLDPGNWYWRWNNVVHDAAAPCTAVGNTLVCTEGGGVGGIGDNEVNYAPPPHDVLSLTGTPTQAFTGFPLHV